MGRRGKGGRKEAGVREGERKKGRRRVFFFFFPLSIIQLREVPLLGSNGESVFSYLLDAVFMLSMMILTPPRPRTICSLS